MYLTPLARSLFLAFSLLPQHWLSRQVGRLTRSRVRPWKNLFMRRFIAHYAMDLDEALESDAQAYPHFDALFTRELKPGRRPLPADGWAVACPVDGTVSQVGQIDGERLLQAKGAWFGLTELLGGSRTRARPFDGGHFVTLYLSPRDYHRVHMPLAGRLVETVHVPGRLFPVNPPMVRGAPGLFARNERVCALFQTDVGAMGVVLVGAFFVGGIETAWSGLVTPPSAQSVRAWVPTAPVELGRGAQMGCFHMGSTVIVLFGPNRVRWGEQVAAGTVLRMGESIGRCRLDHGSEPVHAVAGHG